MKRIICACICCLLLCSCGKNTARVTVVTRGISYTAHIFYYDKEYECDVKVDSGGKAEFLVTKPKNLKDFTLVFENGKITAKYKNLEFTPELSAMPQGSFLKELYAVISFFENNSYTVYKHNETFYVKGKADTLDFKLKLSEAGLPLEVEFDSEFKIIFSKVAYI